MSGESAANGIPNSVIAIYSLSWPRQNSLLTPRQSQHPSHPRLAPGFVLKTGGACHFSLQFNRQLGLVQVRNFIGQGVGGFACIA